MKFLSKKTVEVGGKSNIIHTFESGNGTFLSHIKNDYFECIKDQNDNTIDLQDLIGCTVLETIANLQVHECKPKSSVKKVATKKKPVKV